MLIRAAAFATIWFDDPAIGWVSRPMTVTAGRCHSRSYTLVDGSPASSTPGRTPHAWRSAVGVGRQRRDAGQLAFGRAADVEPEVVDGGVAVLVDE